MSPNPPVQILIADDQPYISQLLKLWLTAEGFNCREACSAEEALELLAREPFSVLLSDITMPGMSGMDLLSLCREQYPDMAIIMVTGVDDRRTAVRALQLGAYGYLVKPFDQNEVIINVNNALERRRLVRLSREYQSFLEEEVRARTAEVRWREEETALRLVSAAEYRDESTGAHIRRIGLYSATLAKAVGWTQARVDDMRVAASMHDIGKIGVPDNILLKPGRLTPAEFDAIKQHPEAGARILSDSTAPLLQLAQEIALSHHERWDGSGYPRGLAGTAIPESGRIVAIVDVYDALVHDRVYRPAVPEILALGLMTEGRGKHFDPAIFDLFLSVLPTLDRIRGTVTGGSHQDIENGNGLE